MYIIYVSYKLLLRDIEIIYMTIYIHIVKNTDIYLLIRAIELSITILLLLNADGVLLVTLRDDVVDITFY